MRTEYTARHTRWNTKLKQAAEAAMERIERLLGSDCSAHIVISEEKSRQLAEVTVTCRAKTFTAQEEGFDMAQALTAALHKVETQAKKRGAKARAIKRHPSASKQTSATPARAAKARPLTQEDMQDAAVALPSGGKEKTPRVLPVITHSFPATRPIAEPHIVRSPELVATRALTLEEAVKEAEFRDREVFVYRNAEGRVHVLFRQRDGKMALVEAP